MFAEDWNSWNTLEELSQHFSDEQACVSYLYSIKWPHGFQCPRCQHSHAYVISTRRLPLYECCACQHQTSLTTDTIMERSRTSLKKWITAIWLVAQHNINAVQLSSIIQVTYKTAWSILHKIRAVISSADADQPLEGTVQGIVSFHSKPLYPTSWELHSTEQPLIIAAAITAHEQITSLKIKTVDRQHLYGKSLRNIACDHFIDLHTYTDISKITIVQQLCRTNRFHYLKKVFQQARRWMIDTFHGIGPKYLQRYLDEFCFRSNAVSGHYSSWDQLIGISMSTHYAPISRHNSTSTVRFAA
ncbi:transposase [Paenibacillus marinisediminis]